MFGKQPSQLAARLAMVSPSGHCAVVFRGPVAYRTDGCVGAKTPVLGGAIEELVFPQTPTQL